MSLYNVPPPPNTFHAGLQLLQLARRYCEDCQVRIDLLTEEAVDLFGSIEVEEASDLADQVAHWQATKVIAEQTIQRCKPFFTL